MIARLLDQQLPRQHAMALIFASASIWGLLWIPLRWLDDIGYSGLWATLAFLIFPIPPFLWMRRKSLIANRRQLLIPCIAGGCAGAGFVLYSTGVIFGSVITTTLLFYLTPVWATILGIFFLGEQNSMRRWLIIALGLAGCALLLRLDIRNLQFFPVDLLGFASGIIWAIGSVAIRRFPETNYLDVTLMQYVLAAILTIAAIAIIGVKPPNLQAAVEGLPIGIITAIIFFPTILIIFRINQYMSPGHVGLLMLSEAVMAILSAMILLGEKLNALQWLGAAFILATALIVAMTNDELQTSTATQSPE